jgi:hypothetical protein
MGHHLLNRKLLHDLGDMESMGHEWTAVTAPFGLTSMVAGAPPSGAPAPKITSATTVQGAGPPPSDELV